MIEEVDGRLAEWAKTVLGDHPVSYQPPDDSEGRPLANLYLLDLLPCPPARGGAGVPPLQFSARYLVTTSLGDQLEAHKLLGRLVFAAMEEPELEVEFDGLPFDCWASIGAKPRPYFLIRMPVRRERTVPEAKPVLHPLRVEVGRITSLHGHVVGPDLTPWPGARVELPSLQMSTQTNSRGYFEFTAVPHEPAEKRLRIIAKRKVFDVAVVQPEAPGEAVQVKLDPMSTEA